MKRQAIPWMLGGIFLAGSAAHAAQPLSAQQKKTMAAAVAANHKRLDVQQPKTMAQAALTERRVAGGAVAVQVPTELWNTLSVAPDTQGRMRVMEADGTTPAAPAPEGPANE